jgi:hypothetical protein
MKKFICWLAGHEWKYNFPSLPNKRICRCCKSKQKMNLKTLEWYDVKKFPFDVRDDEEIIRKWF